jgi:hypothetical protein
MTTVGTFEAKTHLTALLGRVARGEEMLKDRDEHGPRLGKKLTIRQLIDEGRRF